MKSEKLQDAIGLVRDDYLLDAGESAAPSHAHRVWKRALALAACLALVFCLSVPAMAAADNSAAYELLYRLSPALAQQMKPVHESAQDQGILMEVESARIENEQAQLLLRLRDLEGGRLTGEADLFDSYLIRTPCSTTGSCQALDYDEATGEARFLVNLTQWDREPIPGNKVSFSLSRIIPDKRHAVHELALEELLSECGTMAAEEAALRGFSGDTDGTGLRILRPSESLFSPDAGAAITGCAVVDGRIHLQTRYTDVRSTDNHGFVCLLLPDGTELLPEYAVSFWADNGADAFDELVFPPVDGPAGCSICWEYWLGSPAIDGRWEVTIPLE